ncbi:MAG TPA: hypothetical protein VMK12_09880 [Anaeromyxobacteraceae bacterium]|nr:hypothetical protein [Anaeromyxobacteraceae bacterium]
MKRISLAAAAALGLGVAAPAYATVGVKAGAWDVEFTGNVNAFANFTVCDHTSFGVESNGGLACNEPSGQPNTMSIQSGLLPSAMVITLKTHQLGLDIGATIGFYPGVGTNTPGAKANGDGQTARNAVGFSSIDTRQNFLTFGNEKTWGTVKLGRDLGLFAGRAILSDMTLLGVGSSAFAQAYVTFGHIGTGYLYADWIPQITYTSPSVYGAQLSIGAFQGMDIGTTFGRHETPGGQAELSYTWKGSVGGTVWASGAIQNSKNNADQSITTAAGDLGAKVSIADLDLLVYGYVAQGFGTTFWGANALSATNGKRESWGYWGQVTYKLGKLKPGVSFGQSRLELASDENPSAATSSGLIDRNSLLTVGLYYALTDAVNLVAEYNHTWSTNHLNQTENDNTGSLGSILFF